MGVNAPHVLHVGCAQESLPSAMQHCLSTRLDIDPKWEPDIVGDMTALPDGIGPFDAVYGSHCLEHIPFHKVDACLKGWLKVLKPGAVLILLLPDLEGLEPTDQVMYKASGGLEVRARDLFYGHSTLIQEWPMMQHLSGFTSATLRKFLEEAGFINVKVGRGQEQGCHNLFAVAVRPN
jgi:SAM-dependent methyltransferase